MTRPNTCSTRILPTSSPQPTLRSPDRAVGAERPWLKVPPGQRGHWMPATRLRTNQRSTSANRQRCRLSLARCRQRSTTAPWRAGRKRAKIGCPSIPHSSPLCSRLSSLEEDHRFDPLSGGISDIRDGARRAAISRLHTWDAQHRPRRERPSKGIAPVLQDVGEEEIRGTLPESGSG